MSNNKLQAVHERRQHPRFPGIGAAQIVVVDARRKPVAKTTGWEVLDASEGGVGMATEHPCCVGAKLCVLPDAAPGTMFDVEVVSQATLTDGRTRMGCRVSGGAMPAGVMAMD